jgi:hypothetical protein
VVWWEGWRRTVEPEEDLSDGESEGVAGDMMDDAEELEEMEMEGGSGISEMSRRAGSPPGLPSGGGAGAGSARPRGLRMFIVGGVASASSLSRAFISVIPRTAAAALEAVEDETERDDVDTDAER